MDVDDPDDAARLVYADWLMERGDARGEFIRLSCEIEREGDPEVRDELAAKIERISRKHERAWLGELRGHVIGPKWKRGLLERVSVRASVMPRAAAVLARVRPSVRVCVIGLTGANAPSLFAADALAGVRRLSLDGQRLGPSWAKLLSSPSLRGLERLWLRDTRFGDAGAEALAASPHLGQLTHLDIVNARIGDAGLAALRTASFFPRLRKLSMWANPFTPRGVIAMIRGGLGTLEGWHLGGSCVDDDMAEALAGEPTATSLRALSLIEVELGTRGAAALVASPYLRRDLEVWVRDKPGIRRDYEMHGMLHKGFSKRA